MVSKVVKKIRSRIKSKEWLYEVVASKKTGKMSVRLATMLTELVKRYANGPRFKPYVYNEDMQAHAMMFLCKSWHQFKPELSDNPFAFYTQCIKGAFCNYLNKEKKQHNIKEEYKDYISDDNSRVEIDVDDEQHF